MAVIVTLATEHVKLAGTPMLTFGTAPFWITVADADAVQPFAGSVTVTEYDPVVFTGLVLVVTPPPQS